ncbi:membrane transporter [Oryctes borbonicus]|uniref:Membrane transporter n=1 Tax=Oryctes borbonicus TaxID=1629725 RepID=A0A0T6BEI8_9SCAR|nr:membrane transporter [Oryctes borbonicus]
MNILWPTIVSIFLVGGTIGSLTGSWFADKVGRKGGLICGAVLLLIAGILFFSTKMLNSVEVLIIARFVIGLASGTITCIMPMYLTELAPLHLRGAMGVMCPLGVTFGVFIAQVMSLRHVLGTETSWPILLSLYVIVVILCCISFPFLPESPKYLYVVRRQTRQAITILENIRSMNVSELESEINELEIESNDNKKRSEKTFGFWNVLTDRSLLLPLLLVCSMQAGQQFSGINAVFYYSKSTFQKAGLSEENSEYATVGAGVVNFVMAIISVYLMSRFNRRSTFQLSALCSVVCLIILGIAITYINAISWMPYLSVFGVLAYVCTYGIGLGPIPYFIGSELFEVGPRPIAMAVGSMANWGGNFTVAMIFPILQEKIGAASFYIFSFLTFMLFIFVRLYLPETKGRDPSELAQLMKSGFKSRPLSPANTSITDTSVSEEFKK